MSAPFFVVYALEDIGVAQASVGLYLAAQMTGAALSNLLWGHLGDRYGNRTVIVGTSIVGFVAAISALSALALGPLPLYVTFFLIGTTMSGLRLGDSNIILEMSPDHLRATCVALLGTLLAPLATGQPAPASRDLLIWSPGEDETVMRTNPSAGSRNCPTVMVRPPHGRLHTPGPIGAKVISTDPTTGQVIATYTETSPPAVARRLEQAARLQKEWAETDLSVRRGHMLRLADILEQRAGDLAELMALEMGKPVVQGRAEAEKCAWVCRYYADEASVILADQPIETGRTKSYVAYRPLGVVLAIMPWNFPLWQVLRFVVPALMAGNGAILKHASNVTGCAIAIDEMIVEAGFPDGLFRTLVIPSSRVAAIIEDDAIVAVTLTGSDTAGRAVASTAGQALKKTVLELGGSDAYLILEDADVDLAVQACSVGRLLNGGQSCIAAKRFIVHQAVVGEFTAKLVDAMESYQMGNPLDSDTQIGPMARVDLRDELHDQVMRSIDAGARLVIGGFVPDGPGAFYPPTILTDVTSGMPAYSEETFGPVATIVTVADEEEAIAVANDSIFGLAGAVFTQDVARGEQIARDRIESGTCFVNAFAASDPRLPFGGIKASGYGRELSHIGMREFTNMKTIVVS
jgi:succinate-semialdehyde dehydrogenase/glutarate-semialdehyde dehydrogenase